MYTVEMERMGAWAHYRRDDGLSSSSRALSTLAEVQP
jgi:hypothetical protein